MSVRSRHEEEQPSIAARGAAASKALEASRRAHGLLGVLGSPVIVRAERVN